MIRRFSTRDFETDAVTGGEFHQTWQPCFKRVVMCLKLPKHWSHPGCTNIPEILQSIPQYVGRNLKNGSKMPLCFRATFSCTPGEICSVDEIQQFAHNKNGRKIEISFAKLVGGDICRLIKKFHPQARIKAGRSFAVGRASAVGLA